MTYRKVAAVARRCAFCDTEFMAAHRRRVYCSNSCNTRACLARKAVKPSAAPLLAVAPAPSVPTKVTLESNLQNWTMLAVAPQVPKAIGAVLQFLGELFTPTEKGPATWLPAELRQPKQPLVAIEHVSWEEPRFFVELAYAGRTLFYRAAHDLLVVREADGSLRQVRSAAEFAALQPAPKKGLQALIEKYAPDFVAPAQAAPAAALAPGTPLADFPRSLGEDT